MLTEVVYSRDRRPSQRHNGGRSRVVLHEYPHQELYQKLWMRAEAAYPG